MAPKILLLNYTKQEADTVSKQLGPGLKVLRGYISEAYDVHYIEGHTLDVDYSFPEPYYECSMVFLKLPATDDIAAEFKGKTKTLSKDDRDNFRNYWGRRIFVIFVGNTNITNLVRFGIPLGLVESSGIDTAPHSCFRNQNEMQQLAQLLTTQIEMPTARYITELLQPKDQYTEQSQLYYQYQTNYFPYICNENGDVLAAALSHYGGDYSGGKPGAIVTGLTKKLTTTTVKMIEFLGGHYEIFTPGEDWRESAGLYPQNELQQLENEIGVITEKANTEISSRMGEIKAHKQKWHYLGKLVTEQSTPLVDAVYDVLF